MVSWVNQNGRVLSLYLMSVMTFECAEKLGLIKSAGFLKLFAMMGVFLLVFNPLRAKAALAKFSPYGSACLFALVGSMIAVQIMHPGDFRNNFVPFGFLIVFYLLLDRQDDDAFFRSSVVASIFFVGLIVLSLLWLPSTKWMIHNRFIAPFHPNYSGASCAFFLPAILFCQTMNRKLRIGLILILCSVIFWTGSRTALLISLTGFGLYSCRFWTGRISIDRRLIASLGVGFICLLPFASELTFRFVTRGHGYSQIATLTNRTAIWRLFTNRLLDNPWTGLGASSQFVKLTQKFGEKYVQNSFYPHNMWLELAVANGVVVMGCFLLLFVSAIVLAIHGIRHSSDLKRRQELAFSLTVLGMATLHSVSEGVLINLGSPWTLIIWYALLLPFLKRPESHTSSSSSRASR